MTVLVWDRSVGERPERKHKILKYFRFVQKKKKADDMVQNLEMRRMGTLGEALKKKIDRT